MVFGRVGRREIEANFGGGALSSDGGVLLVRQVDRKIGLSAVVIAALSDPRAPERITHSLRNLVATFIAVLELTRMHKIRVSQDKHFEDIFIDRRDPEPALSEAQRLRRDIGQVEMPGDIRCRRGDGLQREDADKDDDQEADDLIDRVDILLRTKLLLCHRHDGGDHG